MSLERSSPMLVRLNSMSCHVAGKTCYSVVPVLSASLCDDPLAARSGNGCLRRETIWSRAITLKLKEHLSLLEYTDLHLHR